MRKLLALLSLLLLCAGMVLAAEKPASDDLIYDQVRMKLAADRDVGGNNITVKVTDGVVELSGVVKKDMVKSRAEKVAKKVKGVKSVDNQLKVNPAGQ
jgi:hyperosmotically inducible protein